MRLISISKHCVNHDDDHDHGKDNAQHSGHHHCPSCSAHFIGLTSTTAATSTAQVNTYQNYLTDRALLCSEAPPTPSPNL